MDVSIITKGAHFETQLSRYVVKILLEQNPIADIQDLAEKLAKYIKYLIRRLRIIV